MSDFGTELARLMAGRSVGVRELARMVPCNPGHISNLRNGKARPSAELAEALDERLDAGGSLCALVPANERRGTQSATIAPKTGSAFIQATAQEGRAWARLGAGAETRAALSRVEALVSPLPMPERPEHHYRYDPPKAQMYVATTLSWLGDKAAEGLARQVLAAIEAPGVRPRPRRAALAPLDLALALTAADKHDEAAGVTLEAIKSGRLAPVDGRRAREIVLAVAERGVPEAAELAEVYQAACGDGGADHPV